MRFKIPRERGRPRGMYHKRDDFSSLKYMAAISIKHGIDCKFFFDCFLRAWEKQESKCEDLFIQCRNKTTDSAIFLITKGFKVIAQFPLSINLLQEINPLKKFVEMENWRKPSKRNPIDNPLIKDLKSGMGQINLKAKVIEIPKPKTIFTRVGQSKTVSNVKVKDETGTIQVPLWNQQIYSISVGDTIQFENARVVNYRGECQLWIGKKGKLSVFKKSK
jgi:hypothetical protein